MAVYLCPAGNPAAQRHFDDTVLNFVDFRDDPSLWDAALTTLRQVHPSGLAAMWGSTPGASGGHRKKHNTMQAGDIALFYAQKKFFSVGTIAVPFVNVEAAASLWGWDDRGATWELMFSFSDVTPIDLPVEEFNEAVGYVPSKYVQGFSRLDDDKSLAAMALLELVAPTPPDIDAYLEAGKTLDGPLDREITTASRVEQRILRLALTGGRKVPTASCAICGAEYPMTMLIAAHIKPRSRCSESEKRDIPSIAMLACTFGCDVLFERGYIGVASDGKIVGSTTKPMAEQLTADVVGLTCSAHNEERAAYFAWHLENQFT